MDGSLFSTRRDPHPPLPPSTSERAPRPPAEARPSPVVLRELLIAAASTARGAFPPTVQDDSPRARADGTGAAWKTVKMRKARLRLPPVATSFRLASVP
ncbi:hypothetical protein EVAR_46669_1 [Eumeta japonica]|uniref:Uncharacterized protein n=1 Tax=Eumeta variegata TaxID=151549 RepID=A0A4C1Y5B2_EUMVA|nr:hypothetical protein EVAR_46669_1 [Eumeta japonica]